MGTWSNLKAGLRPEGRNDLCRMWAVSQASSEVLRDCGVRLTDVAGHNVTTGGGDVRGDIYQAGRDVVANFAPTNPPNATYEAVPKWRSSFTQGVLSWLVLYWD